MKQSILEKTLRSTMTEEEQYSLDCQAPFWTLPLFAAVFELLPLCKYERISIGERENISPDDLRKYKKANMLLKNLKKGLQAEMNDDYLLKDQEIHMSPWKLLKWAAENGILLKKKFFCQLSITLMEIYCHFLPSDLNAPKHTLKYHRAFYLKHAQEVISQSPKRMSRKDIYDDSRMQNALSWIRKCGGKYSPRTIKDHWLKKVDPRKRGRPSSTASP